jgi:hypothetical protein
MRKRNVPTFADGLYRCICDPTFMMHLRRDADFREIARYSGNPGQGMYMAGNPMMPNNASFYMGPQAGQAYFLAGEPVMPTGVQFEGVKFYESTNFPSKNVSASFTDGGFCIALLRKLLKVSSSVLRPWAWASVVRTLKCSSTITTTSAASSFLIWQLYAGFESSEQGLHDHCLQLRF